MSPSRPACWTVAFASVGFWITVALAQSAVVLTTHNNSNGVMSPGESLRITVHQARRTPPGSLSNFLALIAGDATVIPNIGAASGLSSPFFPHPNYCITSLGTVQGGSAVGFSANFPVAPGFFSGSYPFQWFTPDIDVLAFDWTAPSVQVPTVVTFGWLADAAHPDIEIYDPMQAGPVGFAAPIHTTYTSTTILVLPAPAAWLALAPLGPWACRRRRAL